MAEGKIRLVAGKWEKKFFNLLNKKFLSFIVRKFNFLFLRIRYQGFRLWLHYVRFIENLLESLMRRWLLKGELLHIFLTNHNLIFK
ncbi:MAG: hypothetical protein Ct9H300mP28_17720 [Pseudomonadota bacterium]|nr:MAG: hypothetical protein Ct9H300mP28_17720 [Pseudomonadota bacterium]